MIKGFIFDLDGVLLTTDRYHYKAWKQIADKLSIPFNEEINNRLRGVSRMNSLEIILSYSSGKFSEVEKEALAEEKNDIYRAYLQKLTPSEVSEDVRETLSSLRSKDYKLAIGSSSKNTMLILEKTDMEKYFDAISDGNNISHCKPDPEVFDKAAEYLNLRNEECVVVEDAESGIDAAKAGGFIAVGIGVASQYKKTDFPIDNLKDILSIKEIMND